MTFQRSCGGFDSRWFVVFAASVTTGGAAGVTAVPVSAEFPASSSAVSV